MISYSVHERDQPKNQGEQNQSEQDQSEVEQRYIPDKFSWTAFAFAPLYLLLRGAFDIWLAFCALIILGFIMLPEPAGSLFYITLSLIIAYEAAAIKRRILAKRGWRLVTIVLAENKIKAQRRFWQTRPEMQS